MPRHRSSADAALAPQLEAARKATAADVISEQLHSMLPLLDHGPGPIALRRAAQALLNAAAPADGIEAMLAAHLVMAHLLAVEHLNAASEYPDGDFHRRNEISYWRQNTETAARLADVLGRYRGRRRDTMRLEHVVIRDQPRTVAVHALPSSALTLPEPAPAVPKLEEVPAPADYQTPTPDA